MKASIAAVVALSLGASSAALAVNVQRDRETGFHVHQAVTSCTLKHCPQGSNHTSGSNNHSNEHDSKGHSGSSGGNSGGSHDDKPGSGKIKPPVVYVPPRTVAAPEVDPATAFAGLTLLAGALAVARGRKARR